MIHHFYFLFVFLITVVTAHGQDGELRLAAGDRLKLDVFGRPDLSGEFEIRSSGVVRLPLLGNLKAEGLLLEELESRVTDGLALGIEQAPSVVLSVAQWRPIYVTGDVRTPRAVPFAPRLSVLKAISQAGGYGAPGSTAEGAILEGIRATEKRNSASARMEALQAQRARLTAERHNIEEITFPEPLVRRRDESEIAKILQSERDLMNSRRASLKAVKEAAERRIEIFKSEIAALVSQRQALEKQLSSFKEDIERSTSLRTQGLEVQARVSLLERGRLDVVSRIAENLSFEARARGGLSTAEQDLIEKPLQRMQDILREIAETERAIRETAEQVRAGVDVIAQTRRSVRIYNVGDHAKELLIIRIIRGTETVLADEATSLLPGDVIGVTISDITERQ